MVTIDAALIQQLLAKRFSPPAWAYLREVFNATGGRASRSADGIAISLWPSRGLHVHGIEIKVNRSDWLRELKQPGKSAPVQAYCDFWWIAAPKVVVDPSELPPTWGLLTLKGTSKLAVAQQAPQLEPKPLSRDFLAALGRRMNECVDHAKVLAKQELADQKEYDRGYEVGMHDAAPRLHQVDRARQTLQRRIDDFEKTSGIKIDNWDGPHLGKAVSVVRNNLFHLERDLWAPFIVAMESALNAARAVQHQIEPLRASAVAGPQGAEARYFKLMYDLLAARERAGGQLSDAEEAEWAEKLDEHWDAMSEVEHDNVERAFSWLSVEAPS